MSLCKISLYKKIINFCKVSLCKKSKVLKSSFALLFAFMLFFMHSAVAAGGGQDASLWDVKDELHKSANYYIWIIYIVCGVIAFFLVSSALVTSPKLPLPKILPSFRLYRFDNVKVWPCTNCANILYPLGAPIVAVDIVISIRAG